MRQFVVSARLKQGAAPEALALIRGGPPFDLDGSRLERHMVFMGEDQLVFVFEGEHQEEVGRRFAETLARKGTGRLGELIEGQPTLQRPVFTWERRPPLEGVTFGPQPGPGDSDGGERD